MSLYFPFGNAENAALWLKLGIGKPGLWIFPSIPMRKKGISQKGISGWFMGLIVLGGTVDGPFQTDSAHRASTTNYNPDRPSAMEFKPLRSLAIGYDSAALEVRRERRRMRRRPRLNVCADETTLNLNPQFANHRNSIFCSER